MSPSTRSAAPRRTRFRPSYRRYLGHVISHLARDTWQVVVPNYQGGEAEVKTFPTVATAKDYVRSIAYETYLVTAALPDGKGVGGKYVTLSPRKAARLFARGKALPAQTYITVDGPDGTCHYVCFGRGKVG